MVIEAARRVVGWPLITVALLFIAYAFTGLYIPGTFGHRGVELELLVDHLYFTTEGIFGIPLGVSATFIFLFILFGAYLDKTGLGKFFIDLANAVRLGQRWPRQSSGYFQWLDGDCIREFSSQCGWYW